MMRATGMQYDVPLRPHPLVEVSRPDSLAASDGDNLMTAWRPLRIGVHLRLFVDLGTHTRHLNGMESWWGCVASLLTTLQQQNQQRHAKHQPPVPFRSMEIFFTTDTISLRQRAKEQWAKFGTVHVYETVNFVHTSEIPQTGSNTALTEW